MKAEKPRDLMNEERRQLTPAGRLGQVLVWGSFVLALLARFVLFREPPSQVPAAPPAFQNQTLWARPGPRFHRSPTLVRPPVAEVPNDLWRLQLEIAPKDVEVLRSYFWNPGREQQQDRPEVLAVVREGDRVYTNVSLHLKGAAGSFRPFDDKPAFTLNFSKNAPGQRFHGFSKISLNNSVQDPTYLCEAISRELYLQAGVPAPRADWATVIVNGRDLGLYVLLEGYNKDFLKNHFKDPKGHLYDGGFCQDISPRLQIDSGDNPDDRTDLNRLLKAASQHDPGMRWQELNQVLDMDRFITLLALEVMTCNWDGYALNKNNYRLYHDPETDRMIFMPHGMDQMFDWPPGRFPADSGIRPGMRGLVARAVINTSEGSRLYLSRLDALRTNLFNNDRLLARVEEMHQHIRPTLEAYDPELARRHDGAVASLANRISRRVQSLNDQLTQAKEPLPFDASGTAAITNWTLRSASQASGFHFDKVEQDGKSLLHIAATTRGGTASWRTRVLLEGGQYRFEGSARVSPAATGSRITLRASGGPRMTGTVTTTSDWVQLSHTFPVDGPISDIVLVCEFSGPKGEAWFDVDSLRLIRE